MVGLPGRALTCSSGHHPHLHGPADHGGHRQPQGAQAEGTNG